MSIISHYYFSLVWINSHYMYCVAFWDCRYLLYHAFASVVYFINYILQKKCLFFQFLGPEAQPTLVLQPYAAQVPQTKLHLELNASLPSFPDIVLSRLPLNLVNSVWWSMSLGKGRRIRLVIFLYFDFVNGYLGRQKLDTTNYDHVMEPHHTSETTFAISKLHFFLVF